jgi:chromosome segregation ATPase
MDVKKYMLLLATAGMFASIAYAQNKKENILDEYKGYRQIVQEMNKAFEYFNNKFDTLAILEKEINEKLGEYNKTNAEKNACMNKVNKFNSEKESIEKKIKELDEISKKYSELSKAAQDEIKKLTDKIKLYDDSIGFYQKKAIDLDREIERIKEEGAVKLNEFKRRFEKIKQEIKPWEEFYKKLRK